jgi:CBS domain-containing protein
MQIADIIKAKGTAVISIDAGQSVNEAIRRLNEHRIGAIVVTEGDGTVAGILTERDVLRECGERCTHLEAHLDPDARVCPAVIRDVMTTDVVFGSPDDDLLVAMAVMTKHRIRHLPVLEDGRLAGIVSIGDLVNAHVQQAEFENRMMKDYIQGATY